MSAATYRELVLLELKPIIEALEMETLRYINSKEQQPWTIPSPFTMQVTSELSDAKRVKELPPEIDRQYVFYLDLNKEKDERLVASLGRLEALKQQQASGYSLAKEEKEREFWAKLRKLHERNRAQERKIAQNCKLIFSLKKDLDRQTEENRKDSENRRATEEQKLLLEQELSRLHDEIGILESIMKSSQKQPQERVSFFEKQTIEQAKIEAIRTNENLEREIQNFQAQIEKLEWELRIARINLNREENNLEIFKKMILDLTEPDFGKPEDEELICELRNLKFKSQIPNIKKCHKDHLEFVRKSGSNPKVREIVYKKCETLERLRMEFENFGLLGQPESQIIQQIEFNFRELKNELSSASPQVL